VAARLAIVPPEASAGCIGFFPFPMHPAAARRKRKTRMETADIRAAFERFSAGQAQFPAFNPRLEFSDQSATLPDAGAFVRRMYVGPGAAERLRAHHDNPEPSRAWKRADAEFRAECEHLRPLLLTAGLKLPAGDDAAGQVLAWAVGDARPTTPLNAFGCVARALRKVLTQLQSDRDQPAKPKRKRSTKPRDVTAKELAAMQAVAEHKGNISQAAKSIGKDRSTVEDAYHRGMTKLGKTICKKRPSTQQLPRDRRGGESTAAGEDRRAD